MLLRRSPIFILTATTLSLYCCKEIYLTITVGGDPASMSSGAQISPDNKYHNMETPCSSL